MAPNSHDVDDRRPMTDGGHDSPRRGPSGRLHLPRWSKDCWRGRAPGMCWLCHFRLVSYGVRRRLRDAIAPAICRAWGHRYDFATDGIRSVAFRSERCGKGVTLTREGGLELPDGTTIEVTD